MPYEWNHNHIPYPVILPCGHAQSCSQDCNGGVSNKKNSGKPSTRPRSKTIERGSNVRDYSFPSAGMPGATPATAIPLCCSPHAPTGPVDGASSAYHKYPAPSAANDFADVFASCRISGSKHAASPQKEKHKGGTSSSHNQRCTACADPECYGRLPPRKPATKQQCIDARIPSSHETAQWDPSVSRPLTLRTYVFDCVSIGTYIHAWAKLSKNDDIISTASGLRNGLRKLSESVNDLKVYMDARKRSNKDRKDGGSGVSSSVGSTDANVAAEGKGIDISTAKYFVKRANALLDRFEVILADTSEKMAASVENVRGMELISYLFDEEMDKTQSLVKDIEVWATRFNANCRQAIA